MKALSEFHYKGVLCRSLNATFLVLIPKVLGAAVVKDFCPISLLGGFYKILAKTWTRCLEEVLCHIISLNQNAFVRGR